MVEVQVKDREIGTCDEGHGRTSEVMVRGQTGDAIVKVRRVG